MKKFLFILFIIGSITITYGQQDAMFSYYMFNHQSVNPAYVGSRQLINATMINRSQWTGFEGAPLSHTISLNAPLLNESMGFGLSVANDNIGPSKLTNFTIDLAYHLKFNDSDHRLAMGVKAGGNFVELDLNSLELDNNNDPAFDPANNRRFLANYGFGVYYYTPTWYAGISSPHMINHDFNSEQRHYFFIGGALFVLNEDLKIRPSTYLKITKDAPVTMDLTGLLIIKDRFWAGLAFRSSFGRIVPTNNKGGGFGLLAGVNLSDQLSLGYTFGYSVGNQTFRYNAGSHEIILRYDYLYKEKKIIKSPRYF